MAIHVLLVDDEPTLLRALARFIQFKRPDWHVATATSADAALGELAETDYDAIVSDMQMPSVTGHELLRVVRDSYPSMARIVLSADAHPRAVVHALGVAHDFLAKPISGLDVIETIELVCTALASRSVPPS